MQELITVPSAGAEDGPIARVLSVLEAATADEHPASLRDVEDRTGLPKATAHRILVQLERMGWLQRSLRAKHYLPGPRLAATSRKALRSHWMHQEGHSILSNLVSVVDETCNMTVLDGFDVLIVDRVETTLPLRYVLDVNSRYPLHCTASGKIFLTWMSDRRRQRYLESHVLESRATRAITSITDLEATLTNVRQQGYALDNEELIAGLVAMAVPITGADKEVLGTLSINAATARRTVADLVQFVPVLKEAATRMATLAETTNPGEADASEE